MFKRIPCVLLFVKYGHYEALSLPALKNGDSRADWLKAVGGLYALKDITPERIMAVEGFAEKTARSIARDLSSRWEEIDAVRKAFPLVQASSTSVPESGGVKSPLSGLNLVFTGVFSVSRDEMKTRAEAMGAKVQSGVNRKTSALVVGDNPGSKLAKAAAMGTPVWTQEEFEEKAGL
jgi:DNA ligase (NAD+)